MIIRKPSDIPSSEITPRSVTLDRRRFLAGLGLLAMGRQTASGAKLSTSKRSPFSTDVTHYNNFYEFGTGKEQPAGLADELQDLAVDRLR
jgi:sulfoxide reductase catalytic subunit YedY